MKTILDYGTYPTEPADILERFNMHESELGATLHNLDPTDLSLLSIRLEDDYYLREAYMEAIERLIGDLA